MFQVALSRAGVGNVFSLPALRLGSRQWSGLAAGLVLSASVACPGQLLARDYRVANEGELNSALRAAGAGDRVLLREGEWKDLYLSIRKGGTVMQPLVVMAEVPGKTVFTGQSYVRISGDNIVFANVVFRDGYAPGSTLINVRGSKGGSPKRNRISGILVDNFSNPDKETKDFWVSLAGEGHRVDHCAFIGKTNAGPTMVIRVDLDEGKPNQHQIEYNYFGPRPNLGANGAETIRVGTSSVVDEVSATRIYRNVFERTDGEPEVVSLKSRDNIVEENTFYEVAGAVTLRHGGHNSVLRNVFVGNGKENTGGVRVTGADHIVAGNYFEGLSGSGYLSALTLMNGEANASSSGYRPVERLALSGNSFFNNNQIAFGAGANDVRTVSPTGVEISGNIFGGEGKLKLREYAPLSGVTFSGNIASRRVGFTNDGTERQDFELRRAANGLLYAYLGGERIEAGVPVDMKPVTWTEVGPDYFTIPSVASAE